jgi:phage terminase Nu1 subunit (DNA packaging protein)
MAVQKAIKSGRITATPDSNGRPKIDPELAGPQWDSNTDLSKSRKVMDDAQEEQPEKEEKKSKDETPSQSYAKARAIREEYLSKIVRLEYEKSCGSLIEVSQIEKGWQHIITTAKTRLLSVPSKVKSRIPHLKLDDIVILEEEIREALEELARGMIQDGA